jgi:hypothetical protein
MLEPSLKVDKVESGFAETEEATAAMQELAIDKDALLAALKR